MTNFCKFDTVVSGLQSRAIEKLCQPAYIFSRRCSGARDRCLDPPKLRQMHQRWAKCDLKSKFTVAASKSPDDRPAGEYISHPSLPPASFAGSFFSSFFSFFFSFFFLFFFSLSIHPRLFHSSTFILRISPFFRYLFTRFIPIYLSLILSFSYQISLVRTYRIHARIRLSSSFFGLFSSFLSISSCVQRKDTSNLSFI